MKSLNGCRGPFLDKQKAFEYIDFTLAEGPDNNVPKWWNW